MQFDALAGIVERQMPQFLRMVEEARLFRVEPVEPGDPTHRSASPDMGSNLLCNFRLPFPVIAIEAARSRNDKSGGWCVVLKELDREGRVFEFLSLNEFKDDYKVMVGEMVAFPEGQSAESVELHGNECDEPTSEHEAKVTDAYLKDYEHLFRINKIAVWKGHLGKLTRVPCDANSINSELKRDPVDDATVAKSQSVLDCDGANVESVRDAEQMVAEIKVALGNRIKRVDILYAKAACLRLAETVIIADHITQPKVFVVEEQPPKMRLFDPEKTEKVTRSPYRPHFIILRPDAIRRMIGCCGQEGSERAAHERRGHWRVFRSEKFKRMRGKAKWIDTFWVGPTEGVVGKNKYIVRLDV